MVESEGMVAEEGEGLRMRAITLPARIGTASSSWDRRLLKISLFQKNDTLKVRS